MALLWIAVILSSAAVVGSLAFLAVRTIRLWRGFRALTAAVDGALGEVNASVDAASTRAAELGAESGRMGESLARLARSRARLAVLTAAIADVRAAFTGFVPRK